jgi:hypothetical protein
LKVHPSVGACDVADNNHFSAAASSAAYAQSFGRGSTTAGDDDEDDDVGLAASTEVDDDDIDEDDESVTMELASDDATDTDECDDGDTLFGASASTVTVAAVAGMSLNDDEGNAGVNESVGTSLLLVDDGSNDNGARFISDGDGRIPNDANPD